MKYSKNNGFSILEMLIAIAVSLILLLIILQLFIQNKNMYQMKNNYVILQDNQRFLHHYLGNFIRIAGYRDFTKDDTLPTIQSVFSGGNKFIDATNNGGTDNSDTLTIRYQGSGNGEGTPDGSIRDCLNRAIDKGITATNVFYINAEHELICQASSSAYETSIQTVIQNIENMQVLLGEDTDGDGSPNRYVNAGYPALNFNNVVSVQISLLLKSPDPIYPVTNDNSYHLLDMVHDIEGDYFLRKVMTFTIQLRNIAPNISS